MTHEYYFNETVKVARHALCLRDLCGAIIVQDDHIIGSGFNGPANNNLKARKCELDLIDSVKPKSDRTCCLHAEWRAIMDALRRQKDLHGSVLYFTRVDQDGNILKSGKPYCTVCSRLALDAGITTWVLWHDDGIHLYDAYEYNDLSYKFHQS